MIAPPPRHVIARVVVAALAEDLAEGGDLTTEAVIDSSVHATAQLVSREAGRIAGIDIGLEVFRQIDERIVAEVLLPDGSDVSNDSLIATIHGPARALLTGERVCLNLVGRLSGIATATRTLVAEVAETGAQIADTRKTTPGLRALEKYAVRVGGGRNHRFGLYDAVLIKDNHLAITESITAAIRSAKEVVGRAAKIEIEIDSVELIAEALSAGADIILLDNMHPRELKKAVTIIQGRAVSEASGGVTLETVRAIAATGVDIISVGALTHSAPQLDVALELDRRLPLGQAQS